MTYPWYAIRVKSQHEKPVTAALQGKDYVTFLPCYCGFWRSPSGQLVNRELPLFPGYVFARFDIENRLPVLTIPGVVSIVAMGKTFVPVDEDEIAALQAVMRSGLPAKAWPFVEVGQRVRVVDGPLRGTEGRINEIRGECSLILSVSLLQRSVAVEIERSWIEPIS